MEIKRECKPSSVLDGHLSRSQRTGHVVAFMTALDFRPWRAACKRSNRRLLRGGLPFSLRRPEGRRFGLCCSHARGARQSGLSTRRIALPRLSPGTHALCSSDFPLAREGASDRPSLLSISVFGCKSAYSAGFFLRCFPENRAHAVDLVPKGRFELPRGYPHYALNVARLPFRHFGSFRDS